RHVRTATTGLPTLALGWSVLRLDRFQVATRHTRTSFSRTRSHRVRRGALESRPWLRQAGSEVDVGTRSGGGSRIRRNYDRPRKYCFAQSYRSEWRSLGRTLPQASSVR